MKNNFISKNGFNVVLASLVIWIVFLLLNIGFIADIAFYVLIAAAILYRKPAREAMLSGSVITSLVDGKVVGIDREEDKICVRIQSSIFDASIIRAPSSCTIANITKQSGLYLSFLSPLSKHLNEKYSLLFNCNKNIDVEIMPSTFALNGVTMYPNENDELDFGDEIGFCMDMSVFMYLPNDAHLKIDIGDSLKASQSIVASF